MVEILNEDVMLWQGRDEPLEISCSRSSRLVASRPGLDPRPENWRQRRLPEYREAETPHPHVRQPADDLAILGDRDGVPGAGSDGVEPPGLLEQRVAEDAASPSECLAPGCTGAERDAARYGGLARSSGTILRPRSCTQPAFARSPSYAIKASWPLRVAPRARLENRTCRPPKARTKRSTGCSIEPSKSKRRVTWRAYLIASHLSRLIAPLCAGAGRCRT